MGSAGRGSGCVFFRCTLAAGGPDKRTIRTVSFFGTDAITMESGGIKVVPDGGGKGRCGDGGRTGKSIRIVSDAGAELAFGGMAMRTVSFLGLTESAMTSKSVPNRLIKNRRIVTRYVGFVPGTDSLAVGEDVRNRD